MNAHALMAFLESGDLELAERAVGAFIAGEYLKRGEVVTSFRIKDVQKRLNMSQRYAYVIVNNLVQKGCLVVDKRTDQGRLHVTVIAPERNAPLHPNAKPIAPERNRTDPLLAKEAKNSARARQAHSLTHPKGLARSPVDNGGPPRPERRAPTEPTRAAFSANDLLDGLVSKLSERDPAQAEIMRARLALRAVEEPKPPEVDDDAPF